MRNEEPGISRVTDILIRTMEPADLESVLRIEEESFPHPWTRDQFMNEINGGSVSRCHVAVRKTEEGRGAAGKEATPAGSVVGFVMAWLVSDELHITNLAVAPEARRCGVAAALLSHTIREAVRQGAVWCQLDVRVTNTPARELYSRLGFKPLGTRKRYYRNGEDAVVMGKELVSDSGA
ncbi:MAG: ribosomal protein S18-alanine N-acetyltransferase [bacterium]|nr:MAG: ribosomal protein S18-alanine N-acetyltransferase [bacterium]